VTAVHGQEGAGGAATGAPDLIVNAERPLPAPLPVGKATAVFVFGTCWHRREALEDLEVLVDGVRHRPAAFARPRADLLQAAVEDDPHGHRLRSGFWATVPIPARSEPGTIELQVAVRLADGTELVAPLGALGVVEAGRAPDLGARPAEAGPGLIAVCMATFEPDPALFRAQIDSLKAQTDQRWVCVISDDCSRREHVTAILEIVADDPRFAFSHSEDRLGFYRNFERAMSLAPPDAEYVALSDQDDRWHPDKLATLRAALGDAALVYSDQRLVDADGRVLRDTLWEGRRNNHTNLASLVVANTITGAAMLFPRDVAELALPFPDSPGFQFHDHWLGLVGLAAGDVAYVDRPLYDYVQHIGAIFGDVTRGPGAAAGGARRLRRPDLPSLRRSLKGWRDPVVSWRAAYFYGYLAREVQVQAALVRCADRLTPSKRRTLQRFVAARDSPPALAWLAFRPARELTGRNETLGSEFALARGVLWSRIAPLLAKVGMLRGRAIADAGFPAPGSFNQKRMRRWRARV
jgi:glycosyltransferase involved in cell wall biosynthesis